jgi:tetratricopeptide (TPR) repeat protein
MRATLAEARQHHQAGDLPRAEQVYRQVLAADPANAQGWYLLGAVCQAQGKLDDAVSSLRQALRLEPHRAAAHNHLGVTLAQQGHLEEAIACFRQALQFQPDWAEAHDNLGLALTKQGRRDEAVASYQRALQCRPDYAPALHNLRQALHSQGKLDDLFDTYQDIVRRQPDSADAWNDLGMELLKREKWTDAAASFEQALRLQPNSAEAHNNLGRALVLLGKIDDAVAHYQTSIRLKPSLVPAYQNLGVALGKKGQHDEAVALCRQALQMAPGSAVGHHSLAWVLMEQGQLQEAVYHYRQALRLEPNDPSMHNNLGIALRHQGHFPEALASFREALRLRPNYAEASNNQAATLRDQGHFAQALTDLEQVLRRKPDYADAHWNRALTWLLLGNFELGWPEYEWRWQRRSPVPRPFSQPCWDGASLAGRTILLHAEQGLGDTLQFIRYAPLVKQHGGTVIAECQPPLLGLLAGCPGVDGLVAQGTPLPHFDVHAALLSLPRIFQTTLATVPANVPYLRADENLVERWRRELSAHTAFKIGIAWQGSPKYSGDRQRSFPLRQFAPLARVAGVQLLSLQKGLGSEQLAQVADRFAVTDLAGRLDETSGPFMDTAAVMKSLDLVITCDSVLGHLAGALGVPAWVALPFVPDWRWLLDREDSPWYPSLRLFRQTQLDDWEDVFQRMAIALSKVLARPRSITIEVAPGELIDKITILEIKEARLTDPAKLANVRRELDVLTAARAQGMQGSAALAHLTAELRVVNEALWQIEDEIRLCERVQDFGPRFVTLARSVYQQNDRRAVLKRKINELLGSSLMEEKGYTAYDPNS